MPKPLVKIADKPILIHTLCALAESKSIKRIILAVHKEYLDKFQEVLKRFPVKKRIDLVLGGASRRESVENCLKTIDSAANIILVHDAVRPFVSKDLIDRLLKEAKKCPAVICGVPVKATIKSVRCQVSGVIKSVKSQVSSVKREYIVERTLNREKLWEIQTPQVFRKDVLNKAYKEYTDKETKSGFWQLASGYSRVKRGDITDDASLVEKLGVKVKVVRGSYFNIKITTPEDLVFANAILKSSSSLLSS